MNLTERVFVIKYDGGAVSKFEDIVVKEYALTIVLDGVEFITLLCTPEMLEYLTIGFLLSESIIKGFEDIRSIRVFEDRGIVEVNTEESSSIAKKLYGKRTMTTGCGKGATFYNAVDSLSCRSVTGDVKVDVQDIIELMKKFNKNSELFLSTGGVHSVALCQGKEILLFHEDIGRHNALDKVIGEAAFKGIDTSDKMMVMSGRISSEILIKAAKRKIPIVISRSAPTDLAIDYANNLGITVIGFARGNRMNIYTRDDRIMY
jgi:FdhD protein